MNCLSGRCNLGNTEKRETNAQPDHYVGSALELEISRIKVFDCCGQACFYHQDRRTVSGMIGYLSNTAALRQKFGIDATDDVIIIEAIYAQAGFQELYRSLEGVFTTIIYDERSQEGFIFQDKNGSNLPLYYVLQGHEVAFSTSLKYLLSSLNFKRQMNIQGARDFLFYRYLFNANMIPNEQTLIKGINKLVPDKYIYMNVNRQAVDVKPLKRQSEQPHCTAKNLLGSIEGSVKALYRSLKDKKVFGSLSSGFDTNYLTYTLQKLSQDTLTVLTVGGRDKNEVPASAAIAKSYPCLNHVTSVLGANALDSFPDMVWKLEGYVFDVSSFLQYELARQLRMRGAKAVFVGDGADQIIDFSLYALQTKIKRQFWLNLLAKLYHNYFSKKQFKGFKIFKPFFYLRDKVTKHVSYYIMLDYIIKNGGLLLNGNDIQGIYPYLEKDVWIQAHKLGVLNFQKRWYKRQIKKELPKNVAAHLVKKGGHTDIEYIFKEREEALLNKIKKSDIPHSLLPDSMLDVVIGDPQTYMYFILLLLYLCVFQELFISGRYDSFFCSQDLNISLEAFL